jgi:hypothetical protein
MMPRRFEAYKALSIAALRPIPRDCFRCPAAGSARETIRLPQRRSLFQLISAYIVCESRTRPIR